MFIFSAFSEKNNLAPMGFIPARIGNFAASQA